MCLQTIWLQPKVADKDMIVYKELAHESGDILYRAPYSPFHYELGKLYETEMQESDDCASLDETANTWKYSLEDYDTEYKSIGQGFHSAQSQRRLEGGSFCICKCIIPKGSLYYADGTGLLVSNKIIIVEEINQ